MKELPLLTVAEIEAAMRRAQGHEHASAGVRLGIAPLGSERGGVFRRQGSAGFAPIVVTAPSASELGARLLRLIEECRADLVIVADGDERASSGLVNVLQTAGTGAPIFPAGFREAALAGRYRSRGDELFFDLAEWLRIRGTVPRSDLVAEELAALRYIHDVDGRIALEDHQTLRVTPAMEAGVSDRVWAIDRIVRLLETWAVEPPYPKLGELAGRTSTLFSQLALWIGLIVFLAGFFLWILNSERARLPMLGGLAALFLRLAADAFGHIDGGSISYPGQPTMHFRRWRYAFKALIYVAIALGFGYWAVMPFLPATIRISN